MRIVCPSCSAAYDVPDSLVTAGRTVRCARCGGDWTPVKAAAPEPPPPATEPPATQAMPTARQSAMDRLAAQPALPPKSMRLQLAWAGSLVLLALLVSAAYVWRSDVVAAWPPSARAYSAFGLHPPTESPR